MFACKEKKEKKIERIDTHTHKKRKNLHFSCFRTLFIVYVHTAQD